jgi:hypothetical protein
LLPDEGIGLPASCGEVPKTRTQAKNCQPVAWNVVLTHWLAKV